MPLPSPSCDNIYLNVDEGNSDYFSGDYRQERHEREVTEIVRLLRKLGHDPVTRGMKEEGPDIWLRDLDLGDEVKSFDENRPSYAIEGYWRRITYSQIQSKFKEGEIGLVTNTCDAPVKYKDYLRSLGIIYVYRNPEKGEKYHLQALRVAILQLLSLRDIVENTLQCVCRENGFERIFEFKKVEKDKGGLFLGFSPISDPSITYLIPLQIVLSKPSQYHSLDLVEHIGWILRIMMGEE